MTTTFNVSNESQLDAAIASIDVSGSNSASNTNYTINITSSFQVSSDPLAFNLAGGDVVTINGGGFTMDGGGAHRGFFVYAGTVDINSLAIANTHAVGGAGSGGGGGAGLGGGLFVGSGAAVALINVSFSGDAATGGAGGRSRIGGGGGGLGGAGGSGSGGGGGGVGASATGSQEFGGSGPGGGIVIGASGGGGGGGSNGVGGAGNGGGGGNGFTGAGGGGIGGANGGLVVGIAYEGGAGGFGGGGGGGGEEAFARGGAGGFGGGGGGSGPDGQGGKGGFGGGGGGGSDGGGGGFGGGAGANGISGGGGGGGLGAGGDIFVMQGGSLTLEAGTLGAGTVHGGSGGTGAGAGAGFGSGMFIQGNQAVNLAPVASTTLTIAGVIADQSGSGGSGLGHLNVNGTGTVDLTANNTYAGGTTLTSGSLELGNAHAAGSGEITFAGSTAQLIVDAGDTPANTLGGLQTGDTIDLKGIGAPSASTLYGDGSLTVGGSSGTVTLQLDSALGHCSFGAVSDGSGGILLTVKQADVPTTFSVGNEAQWNAAVAAIDANGADVLPNQQYTINLTSGFTLSSDPDAINLGSGDSLTINGNGDTINGGGAYRGLFVYSGTVDVNNLTLANARAIGGAGGSGQYAGGGGAGLGGGLFVAAGGNVTLSGVNFSGDSATGGAGGAKSGSGGGGGGGLGGAGGNGRFGGGGGVGQQATGNGSAGIVIGAASGGSSSSGAGGANGGGGAAAGGGGGGGGVGGASGSAGFGANGGFGGGGASGVHSIRSGGGNGGFGGGGGGGGNQEGAGGFGGGGGAYHAGGFGAGAGSGNASNGGGGGGALGAGGDVFVQQGATLSIETGAFGAGTVKGGAGGSGAGSGSAYGSGMFIQGNQAVTLAPTASTTLTVAGVIADQTGSGGSGAGSLKIAGAGTVDLTASNTYTGGTTLTSGDLQLGNTHAAGSNAISFAGGSAELSIGLGDAPANMLAGLVSGDKIDLDGIGLAPGSTLNAQGTFTVTGTSSATLNLAPALGEVTFGISSDGSGGTLLTVESETACYCRGTRILTTRGYVAIERLQIGDLVVTASGAHRPVRWLGHRRIACGRHSDPTAVWPVRIQAGALAAGVPARDLWVSPGHSLLLDEVLIQVHRLVNDATIEQVPTASVEYWHVELDTHDVLIAEGVAAESYLDTGNRSAFYEGGDYLEAHPDFKPKHWADTCAPLVMEGSVLQEIKRTVLERAFELGYSITADSDLHIVASGERIEPIVLTEWRYAFVIPPNRGCIELRSRPFVPSHIDPQSPDPRRLGVCVGRLQLDGCDLALDANEALSSGWHELEVYGPTQRQRWSQESAPLPDGTRLVVIDVAGRSHCWSRPKQSQDVALVS